MMAFQAPAPVTADGATQASSVMPVVSWSEDELGMLTMLLDPLNERAPPLRPLETQVALEMLPLFPLPDVSWSVLPLPWLKLYSATSPVLLVGITCTLTLTGVEVAPTFAL